MPRTSRVIDDQPPSPFILSVSGAYAQLLSDWLARRAPDNSLRTRVAGVAPTARVSMMAWADWLTRAANLFPAEPVEIAIGAGIDFRHAGLLGHLVRRMPTLGDALRTYTRYEALQYGRPWARFMAESDPPRLVWPDATGMTHLGVETVALASFCTFVRDRLMLPDVISAVSFAAPAPPDARPWREFFHCPVSFASGETALTFLPEALTASVSHVGSDEHEHLIAATETAAAVTGETASVVATVLGLLQQTLPEGGAQAERLASCLHMAPRTLHKRLSDAGWKFQQLLDASRQQLAIHYLEDEALALAEVAFLLGYSEQSAFTRAFRQWTGVSPGKWRRKNGAMRPPN